MSDPNSRARDRRIKALQRRDTEDISKVYANLMSTPQGRKFLWHLLDLGKWNSQPYSGRRELTDFACGELNVGLQIHSHLVETDVDGYLQMLKDRQDAGREYAAARDADSREFGESAAQPDYASDHPGSET